MQLDAGFGALSAVLDLLVHQKGEVVYVLPKIHRDWKKFDFDGIVVEGGFLIGAKVENNQTRSITVTSKFGGTVKLAHGLGEKYLLDGTETDGAILEKNFVKGEMVTIERID